MSSLSATTRRDPHHTSELPTAPQTQPDTAANTITGIATSAIYTGTLDLKDWVVVPRKEEEEASILTENNLQLALVPVTEQRIETTIPDNNQIAIVPIAKMERNMEFTIRIDKIQTTLKTFIATSCLFMIVGSQMVLHDKQPLAAAVCVILSGTVLYAATNTHIFLGNLIDIIQNPEYYTFTDTKNIQSWNFKAITLQLKKDTIQADWAVKLAIKDIFRGMMN